MILNLKILRNNKVLGKGREQAADLLATVVKTFGLTQPNYTYKETPLDVGSVLVAPNQKLSSSSSTKGNKTKKTNGVIDNNNTPQRSFLCEVSAPIPTPIYELKLIRERGQQRKKSLNGQLPQKHAANGKANGSNNMSINGNGIHQLLPINGSTSNNNKSTLIQTRMGEHVEVPITFPEPKMSKTGVKIYGVGECDSRKAAKNIAALEVIYQVEQMLNIPRGGLQEHIQMNAEKLLQLSESHHNLPYDEEIPGITWHNIPTDSSFAAFKSKTPPRHFVPATRLGNIDFMPQIISNEHAMIAAKAITLSSQDRLPTLDIHANKMVEGSIQRFANVQASSGPLEGVVGTLPGGELNIGLDSIDATVVALIHLFNKMTHAPTQKNITMAVRERYLAMAKAIFREKDTSYGMAKLYVSLPKHQFQDLHNLIDTIPIYTLPKSYANTFRRRPPQRRLLLRHHNSDSRNNNSTIERERQARIETFRQHQKLHPLPVDSVEEEIPHDVSVTIVRGGTGSGKVRLNACSVKKSTYITSTHGLCY